MITVMNSRLESNLKNKNALGEHLPFGLQFITPQGFLFGRLVCLTEIHKNKEKVGKNGI